MSRNLRFLLAAAPLVLPACSSLRYGPTIHYGTTLREVREEVTGTPTFAFHSKLPAEVEIRGDRKNRYYPLRWPKNAPDPKKLNTDKPMHFVLLEQKGGRWSEDNTQTSSEIVRVTSGSKLIYDGSICHTHHQPMTRALLNEATIEGIYRLPSFSKAAATEFPNLGTLYPLCSSGTWGRITWLCPGCIKAKKAWDWRHRNSPARFWGAI